MEDQFDYDVFISFSSDDESLVRPIWSKLSNDGLRVFWSDSTLKKQLGNSWFDAIQSAVGRSRHFLLVCSDNSMNSSWVQEEFKAFYSFHRKRNKRILIPLLINGFEVSNLPDFLRLLQIIHYTPGDSLEEVSQIFGGVSIQKLRIEIAGIERAGSSS